MELHKVIKQARKEYGDTQAVFAKRLGVSRVHYCGVESGNRSVTLELLKKIDVVTGKQLVIIYIDRV